MIIHACAPTSLFEIGAWTDTAFAEHGTALGYATSYYARVTIAPSGVPGLSLEGLHLPYPGIDAFFHAAAHYFGLDGLRARITTDLSPEMAPQGVAAGAVALAGGLACYAGRMLTSHQVAAIAHQLLCEEIGCTDGVQYCMTAATGGIGWYDIAPYPRVFPRPFDVLPAMLGELEQRLLLVETGLSRGNRALTAAEFRCQSGDAGMNGILWKLRSLPRQASDALLAGEFSTLGAVMHTQSALLQQVYPGIESQASRQIAQIACRHGAHGVATHASGSLVVVLCEPDNREALEAALHAAKFSTHAMPIDHYGLRVWRREDDILHTTPPVDAHAKAA